METDLEDLMHLSLAAMPLPSGHHQEGRHLGIGGVCHSQRFVTTRAESRAGAKVELTSTE